MLPATEQRSLACVSQQGQVHQHCAQNAKADSTFQHQACAEFCPLYDKIIGVLITDAQGDAAI